MKLYFAGAEAMPSEYSLMVKRALTSYAYGKKTLRVLNDFEDVFLDCGAFTAFTLKKKIDHKKYIEFIKENHIKIYASLDVIGNAEESKNNYLAEIKEGLVPIPAFHYSEKIDYLKYYLDNSNYIALGGVAQLKLDRKKLFRFFDNCFNLISKYKTKIKIHGYAINAIDLLKRYPFYSVDATTWKSGSMYRKLLNPNGFRFLSMAKKRKTKEQIEAVHDKAKSNLNVFAVFKTDKYSAYDFYNVQSLVKLEKYITDLWTKRGVIWNE